MRGKHTWKYGTEIRREEFTIFQPAAARGDLNFDSTLTDDPANIGTGGTGFASFMAGLTSGGGINNLHNVDYFRNTYAFYAQDDWKIAPHLVLNLGLRYELFGTVSERSDQTGNFDLSNPTDPTIIVPKGQNAQLTPFIAQFVKIKRYRQPRPDQFGPEQFRAARRLRLGVHSEDGAASGIRYLLWRTGERTVFESESGIQPAVFCKSVAGCAMRRALSEPGRTGLQSYGHTDIGVGLSGQRTG